MFSSAVAELVVSLKILADIVSVFWYKFFFTIHKVGPLALIH